MGIIFPAACTSEKIQPGLPVCNLFAKSGQIVRAAGRILLPENAGGVFGQT